jgi:uncharacterized protein YbjT (DUF2867 family)
MTKPGEDRVMNIVAVGASGLIGAKVLDILTANGHQVLPASRRSGVDIPATW